VSAWLSKAWHVLLALHTHSAGNPALQPAVYLAYLWLVAASLCHRRVSIDPTAIVTAAADGGCLGNAAAVVLPPLVRAGQGAVKTARHHRQAATKDTLHGHLSQSWLAVTHRPHAYRMKIVPIPDSVPSEGGGRRGGV
jgi:hypothetical protein